MAIRIATWNIQKLSYKKINIDGMAVALARILLANEIDLLIIIELCEVNYEATAQILAEAMQEVAKEVAKDNSTYFSFVSNSTGKEAYGFIIKNLDVIRPVEWVPNDKYPNSTKENYGMASDPIRDLTTVNWRTWQAPFPQPVVPPFDAHRPFPLVNCFAKNQYLTHELDFSGQTQPLGYAQGIGYRLPCLAMFNVFDKASQSVTLLPIVVCHFAAVFGGKNPLALKQIRDLQALHIAQLFSFYDPTWQWPANATSGYLCVDNQAVNVRNVAFAGDYNVDFLENDANGGDDLKKSNRNALAAMTPTSAGGGSAAPPALQGLPGPAPPVPFQQFRDSLPIDHINDQALKASPTFFPTILLPWDPLAPPPLNYDAILGALFDYWLYGGSIFSNAAVLNPPDNAKVFPVPLVIVQAAANLPMPYVSVDGPWMHRYARELNHERPVPAISLVMPHTSLTLRDQHLGALLLSDHLPIIFEFPTA